VLGSEEASSSRSVGKVKAQSSGLTKRAASDYSPAHFGLRAPVTESVFLYHRQVYLPKAAEALRAEAAQEKRLKKPQHIKHLSSSNNNINSNSSSASSSPSSWTRATIGKPNTRASRQFRPSTVDSSGRATIRAWRRSSPRAATNNTSPRSTRRSSRSSCPWNTREPESPRPGPRDCVLSSPSYSPAEMPDNTVFYIDVRCAKAIASSVRLLMLFYLLSVYSGFAWSSGSSPSRAGAGTHFPRIFRKVVPARLEPPSNVLRYLHAQDIVIVI
jgi:hypothetical protein